MGKGRSALSSGYRLFPCLLILAVLVSAFGCASKPAYVHEPLPPRGVREDIVDYATTLLGKPYRNGAKGPETFDCSGYVYYVYARFDLSLPVSTEGLSRIGREVSREDMMVGDLAIFKIGADHHVGIVINGLEFIHASKSKGVTIDSIDAPYWKRNFSHFRRIL